MAKEDIGFIISTISLFKTIDSNYFISPSNGYTLQSLLSLEDYTDNGIYTSGKQFFQDIFDLFICTDNHILNLDMIRKKLYLMENLTSSINSIFTNNLRTDIFTVSDIQNFYTYSYSLIYNLKYLIQHIELKEETFNNNEFNQMNLVQNNFKSYILNTFWNKYFLSLSQNSLYNELHTIEQIHQLITPKITTVNTTNNSSLERYLIQITVLYDKKKTPFFDQINYDSKFFDDLKNLQNPKQVYLYFFKDLHSLGQNYSPNYTHNLLGTDTSSTNLFFVNAKNQKFHVKYHLNGLKESYNIFIHSFYYNNNKKIFVGFAFKDLDHYKSSIPQFLYDTQQYTLSLYFFQENQIQAILNHETNIEKLEYTWEKNSTENTNIFSIIENENQKTFTVPTDGSLTFHYIRCKIQITLVNQDTKIIVSKPYRIS